MASTKRLVAALTRRGPHRVLRGNSAFAGLPGVIYTPQSGMNLPGVAFGHDWLTGVDRYAGLLQHLASWGIVAAAPDTERGVAPSALDLAGDLRTALDIITGVRLGPGQISVHPTKLGLVGHGFGGSAAVLAAATTGSNSTGSNSTGSNSTGSNSAKAVVSVFPTVTKPSAEAAAKGLSIPGMVLRAPNDRRTWSDAVEQAQAWDGAVLRTISKAKPTGLAEGRRLTQLLGLPGTDRRTRKSVRAVLTGYLLFTLAGDKSYREFGDPGATLPRTDASDPGLRPAAPQDKFVALFR